MVLGERSGLGSIAIACLIPLGAFVGISLVADPLAGLLHWGSHGAIFLRGIALPLVAVAATILTERWLGGGSLAQALRRVGIWPVSGRQIRVGVAAAIPIGLAYLVLFGLLNIPSMLAAHWPLRLVGFFVAQGLAEEMLFRGFVFRRLREGRSFIRAAALSAVVFSAVHLFWLVGGISSTVLVRFGIAVGFAVLLTFPAAYLFERGGNSLWGFGLLHVAIDSIDLFPGAAADPAGLVVYLAAVTLAVPLVFIGARSIDPEPRSVAQTGC